MKKTMNFRIAVLLVLVLSLAGMLMLAGCGSKAVDQEIYISKTDMPRLDYVEGQDLDLSDGRLTIITNGEESKLPLTDAAIKVTGYDKNKIGEQKLTVTYGEHTTNLTVTVAQRVVAENFETKYFVGDVFKNNIGRLRITGDDMKQFTVNLNDEKVSLVSFDSSVPGFATITVAYNDGKNTYDCQFSVTVYEESEVEFVAPYKVKYNSYDAGVDVSGGYFTVTSADSKLTKQVPVTAEMISGFDLSAATIANRENPLTQTLTVEYLGRQFTYDIQISFKGISVVNHHVENALARIDWEDAKQNGLTGEAAEAAVDAIREYFKLSDSQKEQMSPEAKSLVARAGAIAASQAFYNELGTFSQTFAMDANRTLYFVCASYEQTAADLAKLNDPLSTINVYSTLLRKIEAEFGDLRLDAETVVQNLIYVYTEESEATLLQVLNHLVSVHSLVADIPTEWDAETLKPYGDDLRIAVMEMYNAGYYKNGYYGYYSDILASWREKKDTFDILYTYFLYDYENGKDFMVNYMWGAMPMPGLMEAWYRSLSQALNYSNHFANNGTVDAYLADVSPFMFYYFQTLEIVNAIKTSGNQMLIDIYEIYDCDFITRYYVYSTSCGYLYHAKGMVNSDAFNQLWLNYYGVMKLYIGNQLSAEEHHDALKAMFDSFQQLNPNELLGFLSSLNLMYTNSMGGLPMLGYDENVAYSAFTQILRDYYQTYLHESNQVLFADLLLAMENFALGIYKPTSLEQFNSIMGKVIAGYNALSAEDKANFDTYAGVSYQKYLTLYKLGNGMATATLTTQEQAMFLQLQQEIGKFMETYATMQALQQAGEQVSVDLQVILYGLHSKIEGLYNTFMETASADAINVLFVQPYDVMGMQMTLAQVFYEVDTIASSLMIGQVAVIPMEDGRSNTLTVWEMYEDYGFDAIWGEMAELVYQANFKAEITLTREELVSLMTWMRNLPAYEKSVLVATSLHLTYYRSMNMVLNRVMSESAVAAQVAETILTAESAYAVYAEDNTNQQARDAFLTNMEKLMAIYDTLSADDQAYIAESYNFYLPIYEQIKAEA